MVITDLVYSDIRRLIAEHPPERGGALYGVRGYPLVTHFELDFEGETSSVSYKPSRALVDSVQRVERDTGLQFKGIIHSHPYGLSRPSGPDEQAVASFFQLNPHLSTMSLPIVQQVDQSGRDAVFIHWYRADRGANSQRPVTWPFSGAARSPGVSITAEEFHVLPLNTHVGVVLEKLKGLEFRLRLSGSGKVNHLRVENAQFVGLSAEDRSGRELLYYVTIDYPQVAPLVLCRSDGQMQNLQFHWDGLNALESSLAGLSVALAEQWGSRLRVTNYLGSAPNHIISEGGT